MQVPLQQFLLTLFTESLLPIVPNLSAMLWWLRLGVSNRMSSSFGERIASGGSWALKKTNTRSGLEQVSISTCLFSEHVKKYYGHELKTEIESL